MKVGLAFLEEIGFHCDGKQDSEYLLMNCVHNLTLT